MTTDLPELPELSALGSVTDAGRGALPFALIHGESLVACAAWALGEAGVRVLDASVPWESVREAVGETGEVFVLHDPLCPMTPAAFVAACARAAAADDVVVVGVRPVTDTVKTVRGGLVGATVDREGLVTVCSPIVLPAAVCAALDAPPAGTFAEIVARLRLLAPVLLVEAPPQARRVASGDEVRLLEALTAPF
ncbi:MAG: 2-C-methyl-D-erythritol 4-phosphate cytidylyltransferase [Nocardioides sp.]